MPVLSLIINAQNRATGALRTLNSQLQGLAGGAGSAVTGVGSLSGAIAGGILKANAYAFAVGKAMEALGWFRGKIAEATQLQLEGVNAASTFSAVTGQSYDDASKFIDRLNASLAISAATLPGATQDYKNLAVSIQDNLIDAFKDPSGKLNQKEFESTLISMSESFGALTAASTKDVGGTAMALTKALSGGSLASLRQLAFFEQNPVVLNQLEKALEEQNATLETMDTLDRVKLFQSVGEKLISEDFKENASMTVDGLMQSFQSALFDPTTGIFGIMKDLDPATEGVQSAFATFNKGLAVVIGPDGILAKIGAIAAQMGLNGDVPMLALDAGLKLILRFLNGVNAGLAGVQQILGSGAVDLSAVIGAIAMKISQFFNVEMNLKLTTLGAILGMQLGGALNQGMLALAAMPWGQIFIAIGNVAIGVIGFLVMFIATTAIGIQYAVRSGIQAIVFGITGQMRYMFQGIILSLAGLFGPQAQALAARVFAGLNGLIQNIGQGISMIIEKVKEKVASIVMNIPGVGGMVGGAMGLMSGGGGAPARNVASRADGQMPSIASRADGQIPLIASRADGQIPNAAAGFLGSLGALAAAAGREQRAMPPGAKIVVANSTETIIPRGGGGGANIVINIYEATDPDRIMAIISSRLQAEMEAVLT